MNTNALDRGCYEVFVARENLPAWEDSHGTLQALAFWRHQDMRLGPVVVSSSSFRGFNVHHADGWLMPILRSQDVVKFLADLLPGGMDDVLSDRWERVEIPRP